MRKKRAGILLPEDSSHQPIDLAAAEMFHRVVEAAGEPCCVAHFLQMQSLLLSRPLEASLSPTGYIEEEKCEEVCILAARILRFIMSEHRGSVSLALLTIASMLNGAAQLCEDAQRLVPPQGTGDLVAPFCGDKRTCLDAPPMEGLE